MTIMSDECIYKQIFIMRTVHFCEDIVTGMENKFDSPIFDLLRISIIFGLFDMVINMVFNGQSYSKNE